MELGDLEGVFQPKSFYDFYPSLFSACQATPEELVFSSGPTKEETHVQTVEAQEDDQSTGEAAPWGKTQEATSFGPEEDSGGSSSNIPVMMATEGWRHSLHKE